MFNHKTKQRQKDETLPEISKSATPYDTHDAARLRQRMYQRIAQGHALADIEETARHQWHRQ